MSGHWLSEPQPERTDPGAQVTAADVVSMVAQRVELSGARPVLTGESLGAAEHAALLLLDAMGVRVTATGEPR